MDPMNQVTDLQILNSVGQSARDNTIGQGVSTAAILKEQFATNTASMAGNERLSIAVDRSVRDHSLANKESIERNGVANVDTTYRTSMANSLAIERNGSRVVNTTQRVAGEIETSIERTSGDIQTAQEKIAGETRQILSTNNTAAALLGKDIQLGIASATDHIVLQASKNFGKVELQVESTKSQLQIQYAKDTAVIQESALRNKSELASILKDCCCELKAIVTSSAQNTQQVLYDIDSNRIRDALAAANTENLFAKFKSQQQ